MAEIQRQLQVYQKMIREKYPHIYADDPTILKEDIEIEKINRTAPFYLDESIYDEPELKLKNDQLNKRKKVFKGWLEKRKSSLSFE